EEEHRQHHHLRGAVRDHGSGNGLGDGAVDHFAYACLALLAEVFADAVHDHDGLVHRIAQHGKHTGEHRQREFPLEEREEAEDDDHVVQVGHHVGHRELPFESKAQVHHDADDHHQQSHEAVLDQFAPHLRPHEFHPTQLHVGGGGLQGAHDRLALHGRGFAFAYRQANHDVARGAEILHLEVGVAQGANRTADLVELSGLRIIDLDHSAA